MIISASRRTDIPCWYFDWFMERLRAGYVLTRNPVNPAQVSRIPLGREQVDCIVFWTKDPANCMGRLDELDAMGYRYYFQFTLTPYGKRLEPGLRDKRAIEETFLALSRRLGRERVLWRYDPIILDKEMGTGYHVREFTRMCGLLAPYTGRVTISFVDLYAKLRAKDLREATSGEMAELAAALGAAARRYGLDIRACCERADLTPYGIRPASCIDAGTIERLCGAPLRAGRDKNQRADCGCVESIDIGAYDTCRNGCTYCYANAGPRALTENLKRHDPHGELLVGALREGEAVRERRVESLLERQIGLF